MFRISRRLDCLLAAGLIGLAAPATAQTAAPDALPELGLMGSIPIYWGEAEGVPELLGDHAAPHWARSQLERDYRLRPLDTLTGDSLAALAFLLLAQPRALSPAENVALDAWVRAGGRVLLFADPMLTGESRFAIGDRRRPQDVILLSPILTHWGLELAFDDSRPAGFVSIPGPGAPIPVNLPGSLTVREGEGECRIIAADVLAACSIGTGSAIVLADAAMLDLHDPHPAAESALGWLLREASGESGKARETTRLAPDERNETNALCRAV